jgi:hypothetical protein
MVLTAIVAALAMNSVGTQVQAKLTWHPVPWGDPAAARMPTTGCLLQAGIPNGYETPPGAFSPTFFSVKEGGAVVTRGLLAASKEGEAFDRVWVDWNRNQKFEATEMATAVAGSIMGDDPSTVFAYAEPPVGPNGQLRVRLRTRYNRIYLNLHGVKDQFQLAGVDITPAGYMEGATDFGERPTKVGAIDADCNGAFGEGDLILFDTGERELMSDSCRYGAKSLIQSADGGFWVPLVAKDGSRITFTFDKTPTGEVQVEGCELRVFNLQGPQGEIRLRPVLGKVAVPAGTFKVVSGTFTVKDADRKLWTYSTSSSKAGRIQVRPGLRTTYHAAGPFTLEITVREYPSERLITLSLANRAGDPLADIADAKGQKPPGPQLVLKNAEGKVVKTLPFSYG